MMEVRTPQRLFGTMLELAKASTPKEIILAASVVIYTARRKLYPDLPAADGVPPELVPTVKAIEELTNWDRVEQGHSVRMRLNEEVKSLASLLFESGRAFPCLDPSSITCCHGQWVRHATLVGIVPRHFIFPVIQYFQELPPASDAPSEKNASPSGFYRFQNGEVAWFRAR